MVGCSNTEVVEEDNKEIEVNNGGSLNDASMSDDQNTEIDVKKELVELHMKI